MKTLYNITAQENTGFHFDGNSFDEDSTGEKIAKWVRDNLNKLDLNEEHSCKVTHFKGDITISGDEDIILLVIKDLEIIQL